MRRRFSGFEWFRKQPSHYLIDAILYLLRAVWELSVEVAQLKRQTRHNARQIAILAAKLDTVLHPVIVGLELSLARRKDHMTLTASAIWSDGFVGFDDTTHKMPDGYDVQFSVEPGGDAVVTKTGTLTADVTVGSDQATDVIDATDGTFTATFDVAAPPLPVITGLRLDQTS